jgi:hypothetical protein
LSLVIFPVMIPDLMEFRHTGLDHPIYGPLFELGAYAPVVGSPPGAPPLEAIAGAAFIAAARRCGALLDGNGVDFCNMRPKTVSVASPSQATSASIIHDLIARGVDVSFVFSEDNSGVAALWAIVGQGLPSLGPLPACSIADVWATWLARVGVKLEDGRDLLSAHAGVASETDDQALTHRLRQLYGG